MLKIEIFDKLEAEGQKTLTLNTRVEPDGSFEVFACDESGKVLAKGILWSLELNGRQHCWEGISDDLGLDLDDGKIRDA